MGGEIYDLLLFSSALFLCAGWGKLKLAGVVPGRKKAKKKSRMSKKPTLDVEDTTSDTVLSSVSSSSPSSHVVCHHLPPSASCLQTDFFYGSGSLLHRAGLSHPWPQPLIGPLQPRTAMEPAGRQAGGQRKQACPAAVCVGTFLSLLELRKHESICMRRERAEDGDQIFPLHVMMPLPISSQEIRRRLHEINQIFGQ